MIDADLLKNWFTYHSPDLEQLPLFVYIRDEGHQFAKVINDLVPDCVEKDNAIDAIRAAVMWANAGIACNS
jgi:hypothetical protein